LRIYINRGDDDARLLASKTTDLVGTRSVELGRCSCGSVM
jgi:hypothetical protein